MVVVYHFVFKSCKILKFPTFLLVTHGHLRDLEELSLLKILSSTEILTPSGWMAGPPVRYYKPFFLCWDDPANSFEQGSILRKVKDFSNYRQAQPKSQYSWAELSYVSNFIHPHPGKSF